MAAAAGELLAELREWIAIPSVSADPAHHADVVRSAHWLAGTLRRHGWPIVEVWDRAGGEPILPAVYACWPAADPAAPVVLVYGHHDVQPVDPVGAWRHPPFTPVLVGDELYGRGASDDKGQVLMHLYGLRAHLEASGAFAPAVTVKLLVEGEEESGSPHIERLLTEHGAGLDCDALVVSDTQLFDHDAPSVCTGMRGLVAVDVEFHGAEADLHSGRFGGAVPNPVTALARLVAALHDRDGRVAVPGFYDDVREPTPVERAAFASLPFDERTWLERTARAQATAGEDGWTTLERIWVRPTAEVNGFHGGYTGPGVKTIVPNRAAVKLSFRLVPDQRPDRIRELVRRFVAEHTPPGIQAEVRFHPGDLPPALADPDHPLTGAVLEAVESAFGRPVLLSRTGGSGPPGLLRSVLGVPLAFLGVGLPDDRIHAPDERVRLPVLHRGAEAAALLWRMLPERLAAARGRGGA